MSKIKDATMREILEGYLNSHKALADAKIEVFENENFKLMDGSYELNFSFRWKKNKGGTNEMAVFINSRRDLLNLLKVNIDE